MPTKYLTQFHGGRWFITRALGDGPFRPSYSILAILPGKIDSASVHAALTTAVWVDLEGRDHSLKAGALKIAADAARKAIDSNP